MATKENTVWENIRLQSVCHIGISDTVPDGAAKQLVLNIETHSTITYPKEFKPVVLNTFCSTRA